jgi:phage tail sheath gpL-like
MAIPFQHIPSNLRVPLFYAEVSNSQANTSTQNQRTLIIGQITASGIAPPNVPLQCLGAQDAITQGGAGSMLALMTQAYLANDNFGTVYYLPLSDAGGSTAATGTIVFTASPTAAGTIALYIAGQAVPVAVTASQATTSIATAVAAAINAITSLPVTASASTSTVTITAVNKGLCGNDIDVRFNYIGPSNNEFTPAGLTYTQTGTASGSGYLLAGGATNPTLTTALSNLGSQPFDFIVSPYTDATSMTAISAFLNDTSGRWSYVNQLYGHVFMASRGTSGTLTTLGTTVNDQHSTIMGFYDSPTPNWVWAAAMTGAAAGSLKVDPAIPLQTVPVYGVLQPPAINQFSLSQRNTLLWGGISTFTVDQGGLVHLENVITTYQKNGFGVADNSYLEIETMFTLMYVLRFLQGVVTSKYARVKLAADGTPIAAGSAVVTPSIVKGDLIAAYQQLCFAGECQNPTAFAQGLIVQINATNPNRLDVLYPAILIGQLREFALLAQFRLM